MDAEDELKELVPALPEGDVEMRDGLVVLDFFVLKCEIDKFALPVVHVDKSLVHLQDKQKFLGSAHGEGIIN